MTPEMIELAKRAVACKGWRWMPGMLAVEWAAPGMSLTGGRPVRVDEYWHEVGVWLPDLTDPATLGCLLALVRETYGEATAHTRPFKGRWLVEREDRPYLYDWLCSCGTWGEGNGHVVGGATEAEALVAALEAK